MGAYAPLPWAPPDLATDVVKTIVQPVVDELAARGTPFSGLLYAGLVLTAAGPMVIEFNARFGDPETQVVLPLLETPFAGLLRAAATGRLAEQPPLRWRPGAAVTVVMASSGYPAAARTGDPVDGLATAGERPGVTVLHAGTAQAADGRVLTAGGRVLAVTAIGDTLDAARTAAYAGVDAISFAGAQHRCDIAATAAAGAVAVPASDPAQDEETR
jgi:phosphoribosylamine--glycine ligase